LRAGSNARLFARVAETCAVVAGHDATTRLDRLIESEAWADAALVLLEIVLPQWTLHRLIYDHGEWHCSLSRQPDLPIGLGPMTEATHRSLPLAILSALLQAHQDMSAPIVSSMPSLLQVTPTESYACCDNFG
jgi:hypothetical protein